MKSSEDDTTIKDQAVVAGTNSLPKGQEALRDEKKKTMLKHTVLYASAKYLAQGIGFINSFALRRFMGPTAMGVWSMLQVILNYCGYASFGTTKAMARDYPFYRGKGEHEHAEKLKDLILTFSILMTFIPAVGITIYLAAQWASITPALRMGLVFISVYLFIQRFYDLTLVLLRSDRRFEVVSMLTVIESIGGIIITFSLVYSMNIYGLFIGTALVTLGLLFFIFKVNPYHFRFFWDNTALWRELKLGIPLSASSFLVAFLKGLDKLIVANQLGFLALGYYSIAMMSRTYVNSLPLMFAHVWYPNLQEEYGRRENARSISNYLLTPVFAISIVIPILCGLAVFLVPVLVHLFLPKFILGLLAMKIFLIGALFTAMGRFSNRFLITLDKYLITIPIAILAITVNGVLNWSFIQLGWGIQGVAIGTVISFAVYGLLSYSAAMKHFSSSRQILKDILKPLTMVVLLWIGIVCLDSFVQISNFYVTALIKTVLFLVYSLPFLWILEKRTQVFSHLKKMKFKNKKDGGAPGFNR